MNYFFHFSFLTGLESNIIKSEIDYLMHFLPMAYIRDIIIPNTNLHAKYQDPKWKDMDLDEFLHVLGLLLAMEVYEIHGLRRLYWSSNINELFPGMNFEKVMACKRFERIIAFLQLFGATD